MTATASSVHQSTALGNQGRRKRKATLFGDIRKPGTPIDVDKFATVLKVDDSLGLVFGWAIVCKMDGEPYVDLQNDIIPEDSMLSASMDFMQNSRVSKEMHRGDQTGTVVFAFPLTEDIAKSFGIETKKTGLMIAVRPSADVLAKFKSGEYKGFSIGGFRLEDEEIE
jgi:hypothetical protein